MVAVKKITFAPCVKNGSYFDMSFCLEFNFLQLFDFMFSCQININGTRSVYLRICGKPAFSNIS